MYDAEGGKWSVCRRAPRSHGTGDAPSFLDHSVCLQLYDTAFRMQHEVGARDHAALIMFPTPSASRFQVIPLWARCSYSPTLFLLRRMKMLWVRAARDCVPAQATNTATCGAVRCGWTRNASLLAMPGDNSAISFERTGFPPPLQLQIPRHGKPKTKYAPPAWSATQSLCASDGLASRFSHPLGPGNGPNS